MRADERERFEIGYAEPRLEIVPDNSREIVENMERERFYRGNFNPGEFNNDLNRIIGGVMDKIRKGAK